MSRQPVIPAPEEGEPANDSADPAAPRDYDSDPQGGGGKVQQHHDQSTPDEGGDAPSHGSR